jgi:hypothetical protein
MSFRWQAYARDAQSLHHYRASKEGRQHWLQTVPTQDRQHWVVLHTSWPRGKDKLTPELAEQHHQSPEYESVGAAAAVMDAYARSTMVKPPTESQSQAG